MPEIDHVDRPGDDPATTWAEDNLRATLMAAAGTVESPPAFEERATERLADYPTHRRGSAQRPWLAAAAAVVLLLGGAAAVSGARTENPAPGYGSTGTSEGTTPPTTTNLAEVQVPVFRFGYVPAGFDVQPPTRGPAVTGQLVAFDQDLQDLRAPHPTAPPLITLGVQLDPHPLGNRSMRDRIHEPAAADVAKRVFTSNGIEWALTSKGNGVGVQGWLEGVSIGFDTWERPMAAADLDEVERFLRGISVEKWQPYLDLAKLDPANPEGGSSFPDQMERCEYWAWVRPSRPAGEEAPYGC